MSLRSRLVSRRAGVVLSVAAAGIGGSAFGQAYTLQHTNEIDLSNYFFGPGNHGAGSPSSGFGTNPLSIAFDGTNAYVGGYNQFTTADNVGVVQLSNVLTPSPSGAGLAATQFSTDASGSRGINDMAYDPVSNAVYYAFDTGNTATSFFSRLNLNGTIQWTANTSGVSSLAGTNARAWNVAIDPLGNNSTNPSSPALATIYRSSGRRATYDTSTGAIDYTPSNGAKPGAIVSPSPNAFSFTWRSLAFDSNGDMAGQLGSGITFGVRSNDTTFSTLTGSPNATSDVETKSVTFDNVGSGVGIVTGLLPNASGVNANMLVFTAPAGASNAFTQTLTASDGSQTTINTREIQLRNVNGNTSGLSQVSLNGGEDDLGTVFTSDLKNFAIGKDANGQPVIFSVDFSTKRLDIYSIEPTWTAGSGTISTSNNWQLGIVPSSQMMNAKFPTQTGPTAVDVPGTFITKDLKIDSGAGSYAFNGAGAIQLNGPDTHTANFQIISGNSTIGAAVNLINAGGTDALISAGASLTINGPVSGASNLNKVGAGTLTINGDNSAGYSGATTIRAGVLAVNNANALGNQSANLTITGGTLLDTAGFTTSRNLIIGTGGATLNVTTGTETRTGTFGGNGNFTKLGAGTAAVNPFTVQALTVGAGTLAINAGQSNASKVTSLNVGDNTAATTARLDLNDGDLAIEYSTSSTPINIVKTLLTTGFNQGNWNGNGIASSAAANDPGHHTAIGYAENADLQYVILDNVLLDDTTLLLKYTYYGDSNLDGVVDTNDFNNFLDGFTNSGTDWEHGDYTYDGAVDLGNDFNVFLTSYLFNGGQLGALAEIVNADTQLSASQRSMFLASVPEPTSAAVVGFAALTMAIRRRRRT